MKYTVLIEPRASRDLEAALEWMTVEHNSVINEWYRGILDAILSLECFPARCHLAPENANVPYELRQLMYGKRRNAYRILFTIRGVRVHVLHIRHSARDWIQSDDIDEP